MSGARLIEWKPSRWQYASGSNGTRNGVRLFGTSYAMTKGAGADKGKEWNLNGFLPGMKQSFGRFASEHEAFDRAEEIMLAWLDRLDLLTDGA